MPSRTEKRSCDFSSVAFESRKTQSLVQLLYCNSLATLRSGCKLLSTGSESADSLADTSSSTPLRRQRDSSFTSPRAVQLLLNVPPRHPLCRLPSAANIAQSFRSGRSRLERKTESEGRTMGRTCSSEPSRDQVSYSIDPLIVVAGRCCSCRRR